MKKLLILSCTALMIATLNAQEAEEKKILAGLNVATGINFTQPETGNIDSRAGIDFNAGMSLDWHFAQNIAFSTGLGFEFNRFRHEFNKDAHFEYIDKDIRRRYSEDDDNFNTAGEGVFRVNERRYRNRYINVPTMLRFQTNYMGYFRYFGKFGAIHNFLVRSRTDNYGVELTTGETELLDMASSRNLRFYKASIGLSLGAEWNFAGSTCLVGELGYYFGVTELHQQSALTGDDNSNMHLFESLRDDDNNLINKQDRNYWTPTAQQGQLLLRVSVLF